MVDAECPGLVLEDLGGVSESSPQDHTLDVSGESAVLEKFIVEAFKRYRPAPVAPQASAVGVHVKPRPQAGPAYRESPESLVGVPRRCCRGVVPIRQ